MFTTAIGSVITAILKMLPDTEIRKVLDRFFDIVEDSVKDSSNKIDDAVVLPLLAAGRKLLVIEEVPGSVYEDKPQP